ncbi:MAG TPA: POTRA domain-containing protein [Chthoniobacterales bacterium]|nr:POTRA domain-containing protein [Chthoniobacterales bacterium]
MRWLAILLLIAGFTSLGAQTSGQGVSYEGQTVSSVELVSDPRINVDPYRNLVEQKAGEPYSNEKVQTSISALQKTERFSKVEVSVKPDPAGLQVSFVLEPVFYIGVLQFPGAVKVFSYTRLLQVANLPDENVYEKAQIPKSEAALLKLFEDNGYFQAKVQTDTQLDEHNQLANITFNVNLGKRARIGQIQIQGSSPQENAQLLRSVRSLRAVLTRSSLKTGRPYSPTRIKAATGLMKRHLAKEHRLASQVKVLPPQYHPETNRADLTINVQPGPVVMLRMNGARLSIIPFVSGRRQKQLIPIYEEGTIDRDLVNEGQRNLINFFQEKGYFDVQVKTDFQRQPDKISLTYEIEKGKKHKVEDISFRGNRNLSDDKLRSHIEIAQHHFLSRGRFSQKLLQKSVSDIEAVYRDTGYEQIKVTPEVVDHEPEIDVTFQINEGPQTIVDALKVEGNESIPLDQLHDREGFSLRSGAPFSPRRMADDRSHILAAYLDRGYLNAEVNASLNRHQDDPHQIDVTYSIKENQQVRVSQVVYLGQKRTRKSLIAKTAALGPEEPLSQGKLLAGESELYNLGVFDWSSVGPRRPITTQTDEEAVVKVHESKRNAITYGFGLEISRRGGNIPSGTLAVPGLPTIGLGKAKIVPSEKTFVSPRGSIEFTRRNLRGLAETGAISVLVSRLDQRLLATYTDPHFRGSKWKSLFSLSGERTSENPLFTARLGDASWQLERIINHAKTTTAQFRYDYRQTNLSQVLVPQIVLPEDQHVRLSILSAALIHDTRDKPLDAHNGRYETINLSTNPKALGSSTGFAKLFGQYAYYRPVHGIVWANSIRLGLMEAFGDSHVPTSERFFSGGGTSLRGFPTDSAGPQRNVKVCSTADPSTCDFIRVPVGGNQLFILNSELRIPLPLQIPPIIKEGLGLVVFYDGGNVYHAVNFKSFVNNYTNTVGIGLRYNTPIGPVRFDIGHNLNPVTGIKSTQFFITLGQAF